MTIREQHQKLWRERAEYLNAVRAEHDLVFWKRVEELRKQCRALGHSFNMDERIGPLGANGVGWYECADCGERARLYADGTQAPPQSDTSAV